MASLSQGQVVRVMQVMRVMRVMIGAASWKGSHACLPGNLQGDLLEDLPGDLPQDLPGDPPGRVGNYTSSSCTTRGNAFRVSLSL